MDLTFNETEPLVFAAPIESLHPVNKFVNVARAAGTTGFVPYNTGVQVGSPVVVASPGAIIANPNDVFPATGYRYAPLDFIVAGPHTFSGHVVDTWMALPSTDLGSLVPGQDLTWNLQAAKLPSGYTEAAPLQAFNEIQVNRIGLAPRDRIAVDEALESGLFRAHVILPYETRYILPNRNGEKVVYSEAWRLHDGVLSYEEKCLRDTLPPGWSVAYYVQPTGKVTIRRCQSRIGQYTFDAAEHESHPLRSFPLAPELPNNYEEVSETAATARPVEMFLFDGRHYVKPMRLDYRPAPEEVTKWN